MPCPECSADDEQLTFMQKDQIHYPVRKWNDTEDSRIEWGAGENVGGSPDDWAIYCNECNEVVESGEQWE